MELGIPKLRQGGFFPELLEPRRRWTGPCGGLGGVKLAISDAHAGLTAAIRRIRSSGAVGQPIERVSSHPEPL